jgi:hypothetical protein
MDLDEDKLAARKAFLSYMKCCLTHEGILTGLTLGSLLSAREAHFIPAEIRVKFIDNINMGELEKIALLLDESDGFIEYEQEYTANRAVGLLNELARRALSKKVKQ